MTVEETVEVVRAPRRRTPRAKTAAAKSVEQPEVDSAQEAPESTIQAVSAAPEAPSIEQPPATPETAHAPAATYTEPVEESIAASGMIMKRGQELQRVLAVFDKGPRLVRA